MKKGWEPRQCHHCGEVFEPKSKKTQKFCGPECQQLSRKPKPCVCLYCGETYVPKRSDRDKYCCREHAFAAREDATITRGIEPIIVSVCPHCGGHTKSAGRYCGDACISASLRRRAYEREKVNHDASVEPRACKHCGEDFTPEYGSKRRDFCSKNCARKYGRRVARQRYGTNFNERARKYFRRIYGEVLPIMYERISRKKVLQRDRWLCGICGKPIDRDATAPEPLSASVDHVIALASGGSHTYENVQAAHFECNWKKGDG